jgi:hypothetical protein
MEIVADNWEDLSTVKQFEAVHFALAQIEKFLAGMGGEVAAADIIRWYVSTGVVRFDLSIDLQWPALIEYYKKASGQGEGTCG